MPRSSTDDLTFAALSPSTWGALEALFGPDRGADGGCWCMWWRCPRSQWQALGKAGRKAAFKALCDRQAPLGVLAFSGKEAIGWCAVAPRVDCPSLQRSPVARPLDGTDLVSCWFISCHYVKVGERRSGLTRPLIEAALAYAKDHQARCVEACPTESRARSADRFVGTASTFVACGFTEIARRSATRPLMRYTFDRP